MRGVPPAHQRQAFRRPQQPVDGGVAQVPAAGGLHIQPSGGAVERVQHAAVTHQGNELAWVAGGQGVSGGGDAFKELQQGFTALGREMRVALAPAPGQLGS